MGQYHRLVNLDTKEFVNPHGLGFGSKQYEHTSTEGSLADAMYLLATCSANRGGGDFPLTSVSGRWVGDRIVVVGDYTEDKDIPNYPSASKIYGQLDDENLWTEITGEVREAFKKIFAIDYSLGNYGFWDRQLVD